MARPLPRLVPLTAAAMHALAGAGRLVLERFPFRVGRESHAAAGAGGEESRRLNPDGVIVVGTSQSPFVFRLELADLWPKAASALEKAQAVWKRSPQDAGSRSNSPERGRPLF